MLPTLSFHFSISIFFLPSAVVRWVVTDVPMKYASNKCFSVSTQAWTQDSFHRVLRAQWHQLITQLVTTQLSAGHDRVWSSMRVQLCDQERKEKKKDWEVHVGWMLHWHLSRSVMYFCMWASTKWAKERLESPCSHATWWITSEKCHPRSNYNTSMPSCPTVTRGVSVCVSTEQRQHQLSGPVTVRICRMRRQQVLRDANHGWLDGLAGSLHASHDTADTVKLNPDLNKYSHCLLHLPSCDMADK